MKFHSKAEADSHYLGIELTRSNYNKVKGHKRNQRYTGQISNDTKTHRLKATAEKKDSVQSLADGVVILSQEDENTGVQNHRRPNHYASESRIHNQPLKSKAVSI